MAIHSEDCANRAMAAGAQSLRIGAQFHKPAPVRARRARVNVWPVLGLCIVLAPAAALALAVL